MNIEEKTVLKELQDELLDKGGSKKKDLSLNTEKKVMHKTCCQGAFKYNTKIAAYNDIKDKHHVYFIKINDDGLIKYRLYRECKKNSVDGSGLCHIHKRMQDTNAAELKFFEKDIKPKTDVVDTERYLAQIDDPFFENIEKRNNKEKQKLQVKSKKNNPINLVLNSGNENMITQLTLFATQLLSVNDSKIETKKAIKSASEELIDEISSLKKAESSNSKLESDEEDIDEEDDEDEDEEENDDEDEEVSVVNIETKKGRHLYLSEEKNYIMDPEDEEHTVLGIMTEVASKYSTIIYETKNYTVLKNHNHDEKGKILHCVLSDNVFDESFNHIGKYKKNKSGEIKYKFN